VFPDHSKAATQRAIEPFNERFIAAIKEGVRKFNLIEPSLLYPIFKRKRAKATAIWAFIMEEVETTMRDVPGLKLNEVYGTIEVLIGENILARIKKMRPDGMTANIMTARVTDFHTADQGELFGEMWARPLKVDVGYIEDETGTQVATIMVAHRRNPGRVHWTYEMTPPADVQPLPVAPSVPVAPPRSGETQIVARESENANTNTAQGTDDK